MKNPYHSQFKPTFPFMATDWRWCWPWATEGPNLPKETLTFKKKNFFGKQLRDHYPRALKVFFMMALETSLNIWVYSPCLKSSIWWAWGEALLLEMLCEASRHYWPGEWEREKERERERERERRICVVCQRVSLSERATRWHTAHVHVGWSFVFGETPGQPQESAATD